MKKVNNITLEHYISDEHNFWSTSTLADPNPNPNPNTTPNLNPNTFVVISTW